MARSLKQNKPKRGRLYVDARFQGALALRVVVYWIFTALAITLMLLCGRILLAPTRYFYLRFDDMWLQHGPALIASLVLLPVVLMDVLKLSNRFVGPILRLRSAMRALARGEMVEPIKFRKDDFWQEFAGEFNAIAAQMHRLREGPAPQKEAEEAIVA